MAAPLGMELRERCVGCEGGLVTWPSLLLVSYTTGPVNFIPSTTASAACLIDISASSGTCRAKGW